MCFLRSSRSSKSSPSGSPGFSAGEKKALYPDSSPTYSSPGQTRHDTWGDDRHLTTTDDEFRSVTPRSADVTGDWRGAAKPRSRARSKDSGERAPPSKRHLERSHRSSQRSSTSRSSNRSISPVLPIVRDNHDPEVRSSTPLMSPEKQERRSSSLPPRQRDQDRSLTPSKRPDRRQHRRDRTPQHTGALAPPRVLSSPKSPTFVVIEKTMGQKSMIISWTPPVLDMVRPVAGAGNALGGPHFDLCGPPLKAYQILSVTH